MPNGDAVANIRIACTESWKTKEGEKKESTEWVRVVFFRKLAEIVGQYLKKGSSVYIEGKMVTREWEKDGVKRYSTEIHANEMQMLGGKGGQSDDSEPRQPAPRNAFETRDDDIPFANPDRGRFALVA